MAFAYPLKKPKAGTPYKNRPLQTARTFIQTQDKGHLLYFGESMEEFPELVQEIKEEGHELACHTYSHPFVIETSPGAISRRDKEMYGVD